MNRKTMGLVFAGLLTGAALAAVALRLPEAKFTADEPLVSGRASIGGPFSLIDQTAKRVTDKDFAGRYMLVFFGFTNCPDICPAGLQVMSAALEKLGSRADDVTPIFITLDPTQDTPQKLESYVKSFHPRLVALTGSESEVSSVAKAYRVFYQKVPDEKDSSRYGIDHSAIYYLMGKDGALVAPIPYTTDVDALANAISKALNR